MKSVAVMQPYFFPYLGYFQLVAASSVFVFLDDVTFIKGGWINRNRFLIQGRAHTQSVPLRAASSHRSIRNTAVAEDQNWRPRFLRLLAESYARAPGRVETLSLVEGVIGAPHASIGDLAAASVRAVCAHVGLATDWRHSGSDHPAKELRGAARVIDICQSLGATRYVNAPGGRTLYDRDHFARAGLELRFLHTVLPPYRQPGTEFVAGLSIIDLLMFNSPNVVRRWMDAYELE